MDQRTHERALRAAHTINEQTPTDTARDLARLLYHAGRALSAAELAETTGEPTAHPVKGCTDCTEARDMGIALSGALDSWSRGEVR